MKDEDLREQLNARGLSDEAQRDGVELPEEFSMAEERQLKSWLACWVAPEASEALDQNLLAAFRQHASDALLFKDSPLTDSSTQASLPELSLLSSQEVKTMKQCQTCHEEFADKFIFCPIDGTTLSEAATARTAALANAHEPVFSVSTESESSFPFVSSDAYHLTIIEDAGLLRRLFAELGEAARQSQLTWPELKRDPFGFTRRSAAACGTIIWRFFSGPNVAIATLAAILLMMTAVVGLVLIDRHRAASLAKADKQREDLELVKMVQIPDEAEKPEDGAPGMNKGDGGGSKPERERPGGGGGGGRVENLTASQGKLPIATMEPPVLAPDPKAQPIKNPALPMAATIQADPLLFPTDPRQIPYGDPKSKSDELSSGTGTGGGIGDGNGVGVGSGDGRGYGPGEGFNTGGGPAHPGGGGAGGGGNTTVDYNKVFRANEVTQKARIISKPAPEYTEEARKNQVTGTVVLQLVFSSSGSVTGIRTLSGLPNGLTEKAIAAARRIQFSPAMKDGRPVSQYIKVEYNFNIY